MREYGTYLSRAVGLGGEEEQVVDTVGDVLRYNILLGLVHLGLGNGAIHTNVSDLRHLLSIIILQVILKGIAATEGENKVLEDINGGFPAE